MPLSKKELVTLNKQLAEVDLRYCVKCEQVKPLSEYYNVHKVSWCKDCERERCKGREYTEEQRHNHVVKSTEWQREQYQNNPEFRERMKQHNKRWYDEQDGKGYYHVRNQKRRSRISELEYNFTENDWTKALVYFNYSCAYCGAVVTTGAHQDHVVPLANGGTYTPDNIVPACKSCNCSKGAKELEDWYKTKPFFNEHKLQRIIDFITKNKIDRDLKSE